MSRASHRMATELRAAGLVPTQQRRLVLGALEGCERPASAIEIHARARSNGHKLGLTTVYRTLHALAEAGLVHVFSRDGEHTYRHCRQEPHQHLICGACGLVLERPADTVTPWMEQVRSEADFVPDPQHSDLYGTCGACLRADPCHHRPDGSAHRAR